MYPIKKYLKTIILCFFAITYKGLRPILGIDGVCCYFVTCSQYAHKKISHEPRLLDALWLILKRVLSCSMFSKKNRDYFDA